MRVAGRAVRIGVCLALVAGTAVVDLTATGLVASTAVASTAAAAPAAAARAPAAVPALLPPEPAGQPSDPIGRTSAPALTSSTGMTTYRGITIDQGTYVLWKKKANLVLLVRKGRVVRAMPTTDLDWKTPVGDYRVQRKDRRTWAWDQGRLWVLNYFVDYGPVRGHSGIAFHEVPVRGSDTYIQPLSSVGSPKYHSHGCARLRPADAKAIWDFTSVGTQVRVR